MLLLRPSTEFQRDVCVHSAFASLWAYQDEDAIKSAMVRVAADRCTVINDKATDTQLYIAGDARSLVVAFRGTSSLRDWLTDAEIKQWSWNIFSCAGSEKLHAGFAKAFIAVKDQLFAKLIEYRKTNQYVTFTGHSLGGALAMVAAQWWAEAGFASGLYTFGQPRVWNSAGARMFERIAGKFAWRMVHAEDVVPRVPWLLGSYRHAGNEIFFDAWNKPHFNASTLSKLPSDIYGLCREWKNGKLALLADHSMERYRDLALSIPVELNQRKDAEMEKETA